MGDCCWLGHLALSGWNISTPRSPRDVPAPRCPVPAAPRAPLPATRANSNSLSDREDVAARGVTAFSRETGAALCCSDLRSLLLQPVLWGPAETLRSCVTTFHLSSRPQLLRNMAAAIQK